MGEINRHPIRKWREQFGLQGFIETGTWKGAGVLTAKAAGFPWIWTVEASAKQAEAAKQRVLRQVGRGSSLGSWVNFAVGDSAAVLPDALTAMEQASIGPALFWLDAHYPEQYEGDSVVRLPLLDEVRAIVRHERDHSRDVFVVDDCRIYGKTGASGPLPGFLVPGDPADLEDIVGMLSPTHEVTFDKRDGVYLIALPR